MLKFREDFKNQSIALADGTIIDKHSIDSDHAQMRLAESPWFDFMLEKAEEPQAETLTEEPQAEELTNE